MWTTLRVAAHAHGPDDEDHARNYTLDGTHTGRVVERLPYLALLILTVAFMGYGFRARLRHGKPRDRTFASKLVWVSVGLASSIVGAIFPSLWVIVSFTVNGGRIEDNLPPGYSSQFILVALLVGGAFTAISTAYGFIEHLDA